MWKQKIGISLGNHYDIPTPEIVKLVAEIGFDAISPVWEPGVDLTPVIAAARENGLQLQSLHAPFDKAAELWRSEAIEAKNELLQALEDCHRFGIPVLVMHTWIGFEYTDTPGALGLQNYGEIVDRATAYGVKIAFENTEGQEFLYALMAHFKGNDTVGFCWDAGHELCYNHAEDILGDFGDRLLVTHLNDNLGISRFDGVTFWTDDLHLLPYDGISNWDYNIKRLKAARRLEYLNFELNLTSKPNRHDNDGYRQMPLTQYFATAYQRACRIAFRYTK